VYPKSREGNLTNANHVSFQNLFGKSFSTLTVHEHSF